MIECIKNKSTIALFIVTAICVALNTSFGVEYHESPMLAELVKQGKLPSVEKRLPQNPCVVKVTDKIGQYGGTLYLVATNLDGFGDDMHVVGFEPPLWLNTDSSVSPNLIEKWEWAKDYRSVVLHVRKGMRWSDGESFDANDIMFWWNDEVNNSDLTEIIYFDDFKVAKFNQIDDYTIRISFDEPHPLFNYMLSKQWGYLGRWYSAKHFFKQYNPNYNDKELLKKKAKEAGFDTVMKLYWGRGGWYAKQRFPETPVMTAFVLKEKHQTYYVWERNPFYFKVDEAGNQLPYIDRIVVRRIDDKETIQGQIISGQVDFEAWNTVVSNIPLYKKFEKAGNYRTLVWQTDHGSEVKYMINMNSENKQLHKLFNNLKFRQALSLSINRGELNTLLYFNKAVPRQSVPIPGDKYYNEKDASYCVEYDPVKANSLLDEIGLSKRDDAGYRLDENGKRVEFTIEFSTDEPPEKAPMTELVKEYWNKLGLHVEEKAISNVLLGERGEANKIDATNWNGGNVTVSSWQLGGIPPLPDSGISYAPLVGLWFKNKGVKGLKPEGEMLEMINDFNRVQTTTDDNERFRLGQRIWEIVSHNLWEIGTLGMAPYPVIVNIRLKNVPEKGFWGDLLWLHPYHPEQFYLEQ